MTEMLVGDYPSINSFLIFGNFPFLCAVFIKQAVFSDIGKFCQSFQSITERRCGLGRLENKNKVNRHFSQTQFALRVPEKSMKTTNMVANIWSLWQVFILNKVTNPRIALCHIN